MTPTPSNDETGNRDDVVNKKLRIKDGDSAAQVGKLMKKSESELSDESKLLIILGFHNVCLPGNESKSSNDKAVIKALFKKDKNTGQNGIAILERWKKEAVAILDRLAKYKTDASWYKDVTAYYYLIDYIRFAKSCFVVDSKKILNRLKDDFGVEWNQPDYLKDVSAVCLWK